MFQQTEGRAGVDRLRISHVHCYVAKVCFLVVIIIQYSLGPV